MIPKISTDTIEEQRKENFATGHTCFPPLAFTKWNPVHLASAKHSWLQSSKLLSPLIALGQSPESQSSPRQPPLPIKKWDPPEWDFLLRKSLRLAHLLITFFSPKGQITLGHAMNFLQMHVLMGRISLQSIVNYKLSPVIKALPRLFKTSLQIEFGNQSKIEDFWQWIDEFKNMRGSTRVMTSYF